MVVFTDWRLPTTVGQMDIQERRIVHSEASLVDGKTAFPLLPTQSTSIQYCVTFDGVKELDLDFADRLNSYLS